MFAATGSRSLKNNILKINIVNEGNSAQALPLAQFHVCDNKIDICASWFN